MSAGRHRIKARRERLGLTQRLLAKLAGVPYPADVHNAETGRASEQRTRKVRLALIAEEKKRRDLRREGQRIERNRALWREIPETEETKRLLEAMLDRAWQCLDAGQTEAADAILEFVPDHKARALLDEFFFSEEDKAA